MDVRHVLVIQDLWTNGYQKKSIKKKPRIRKKFNARKFDSSNSENRMTSSKFHKSRRKKGQIDSSKTYKKRSGRS